MNSTELQKKFPEVYRDFFTRNDLVLSGCFVLPWTREAGNDSKNYLRFKTTLPLKCFIGIKTRSDGEIKFNEVSSFDINSEQFETLKYEEINKEGDEIKRLLKMELSKLGLEKGVEIEILSETTRGHGFGFSGVSAAIISYGIHRITNLSYGNKLLEEGQFLDKNFNKIFALAGKMDYVWRYGDTFGHNSIFALRPNKGVSYFLTDKVDLNIDQIDKIDDFFYEFNKINNANELDLPFDYFLIFSGTPTDTKQIEYYKRLEYLDSSTHKFVEEELSNNKEIYLSKFTDEKLILDLKLDMISIQNINTLNLLNKIYTEAYDDNLINDFIEQLNSSRKAVSLLEEQNSFADDLSFFFRKNKLNHNEIIGLCPVYSGRFGGGYIISTKSGLSRKTILKTMEDLKTIYPNSVIEYCSYIDGTCGDAIKVEQHISAGLYSRYVDKNSVIYKDNKGNSYLGEYSKLIETENHGLLFDMINNKIYLNGEKLTSKDIPSQNTTIEVVTKLLENIGEEISNKDLPASSYTSNKNEMLGKIILPLLKLIEEKTGEQLSIVCKGSIADFYIKIGEINLKIGTIKKI